MVDKEEQEIIEELKRINDSFSDWLLENENDEGKSYREYRYISYEDEDDESSQDEENE